MTISRPGAPDDLDSVVPARRARPAPEPETAREMLQQALALIEFVPVAGPPVVLLVVPLVILSLMVAGPFVLLLTIVVAIVAAALLVALAGAVLASPYLLVRRLRRLRAARSMPIRSFVTPIAADEH